jgi:hypothetical protein
VDVPEEVEFSWWSMVQKPSDSRLAGLDNRGKSLISGAPRQPRLMRKPWVQSFPQALVFRFQRIETLEELL